MRLKIFRAASMQDAMAQMRAELGSDALIMDTRAYKTGVELTAGIDTPEPAAPELAPPERPRTPIWPAAPRCAIHAIVDHHGIPPCVAQQMSGATLPQLLARLLRFAPIDVDAGALLFVGPPGAGKTSTVARLATRLVMAGRRPLVITADGRRAGATEQLAAYTRLLGLDLVVATHPSALARSMACRESNEPVLIDAPGTDAHDRAQLQELVDMAAAVAARMAVVAPAGLDPREAADLAAAHAEIGATLLVATRIDHARRLGSVISAAASRALALTEAGIGPGAADGLVPLTAELLADQLQRAVPLSPRPRPPLPPINHEASA